MTITSHFKTNIKQLGSDVDGYVLDEVDGEKPRHPHCVLSKRGAASALGLKSEGGSALWRTLSRKNIDAVMGPARSEQLMWLSPDR